MDASNLSPLILCAFGVTVMGFVSRLYFGAPGAREHLSYLTTRWQVYTLRRGDQVWAPGRWSLLSLSGLQVYARMHGVRNFSVFEAQLTEAYKSGAPVRETLFVAAPTWMPNESAIEIQPETARDARLSNREPVLVAHGLAVYAQPSDLAAAFDSPEGEQVLEAMAHLPAGTTLHASREDRYKHFSVPPASASLRVPHWCVDADELDDCIDLVTRFCRLCRATS